jgi:hypothetical protein
LGIRVREVNHSEAAYLTDRRVFERALFPYPFKAGDVESMLQRPRWEGVTPRLQF